jgi:fructose-1,6-bisphosphatase/inositol monophosphatase family enzyme
VIVQRIGANLDIPPQANLSALELASGDLEVALHLRGEPWDHSPFVVIVEEAGGCFCDLWGGRRLDTGTAVSTNNPAALRAVLELVRWDRPSTIS